MDGQGTGEGELDLVVVEHLDDITAELAAATLRVTARGLLGTGDGMSVSNRHSDALDGPGRVEAGRLQAVVLREGIKLGQIAMGDAVILARRDDGANCVLML